MSVSDTLSNFWYLTDSELPTMNKHAYWLMNRMMQMKCEAVTSEEDWAWMQAMGDYVAKYNSLIGRSMDKRASENMAIQDIENLIDHYSGGNQPELNTWTYVMSVLSYYKTINMYDRLIMCIDCSSLKEEIQREYEVWHKLNRALNGFMLNYTYAGASYSSLPMDINGMAEYWSCKRYEELVIEEAILVYDKSFKSDSITVSLDKVDTLLMSFDDIELEDVIAKLEADFESTEWVRERFGECLDMQIVREYVTDIRMSIRNWLTERERIADMLPKSQKESYKELTKQMLHRFCGDIADLIKLIY